MRHVTHRRLALMQSSWQKAPQFLQGTMAFTLQLTAPETPFWARAGGLGSRGTPEDLSSILFPLLAALAFTLTIGGVMFGGLEGDGALVSSSPGSRGWELPGRGELCRKSSLSSQIEFCSVKSFLSSTGPNISVLSGMGLSFWLMRWRIPLGMTAGVWTLAGRVGRQSARLRSEAGGGAGGAEEARGGAASRLEAGMATNSPSGDCTSTKRPDTGLGDAEAVLRPPSDSCDEKVL